MIAPLKAIFRLLAALALLHALSARATELSVTPRPAPPSNAPAEAPLSFQGFGEKDPTCLAWTDGCRSCQRETDNPVNCSNVGIACQPSADKCTARAK
jgi:hypothetical protein